jgi:hypothetical protein
VGEPALSSVYQFFSDRAPTHQTVTGNSAGELPALFGIRVASNLAGCLMGARLRSSNLSRITCSLFMRPLGQVLLDLGRTTFELFGASHAKVHSLWFQRAGAATIPERRAASAGRATLTRAHALQSRIKSRKGAVTHEPNLNAKRRMNGRRTDSSPRFRNRPGPRRLSRTPPGTRIAGAASKSCPVVSDCGRQIACWTKLEITPPSFSNHPRYGTRATTQPADCAGPARTGRMHS